MKLQSKNAAADLLEGFHIPAKKVSALGQSGPAIPSQPISVSLEEKIDCKITREGTLESMEIKGILNVTVNDGIASCSKIIISKEDTGFNVASKPKIDKKLLSTGVIQMKNPKEPIGTVGKPSAVLRWTKGFSQDEDIPLNVQVWPESSSGRTMKVNVEISLQNTDYELHNVCILIPTGGNDKPKIDSQDIGDCHFISFYFIKNSFINLYKKVVVYNGILN